MKQTLPGERDRGGGERGRERERDGVYNGTEGNGIILLSANVPSSLMLCYLTLIKMAAITTVGNYTLSDSFFLLRPFLISLSFTHSLPQPFFIHFLSFTFFCFALLYTFLEDKLVTLEVSNSYITQY